MIPDQVLSQEEEEDVQRRCKGIPPKTSNPSSQQPILQDPFHHSRVDHCVTELRDSAVEESELPNRKRYHRNSGETESILPTSAVNRGFIHGDSSFSHRKVRKVGSPDVISSRLDADDYGDHAWHSYEEFLQYSGENSNNIPHMSGISSDAMFPIPSYGANMWSNVGDSNGPVSLPVTERLGECSQGLRQQMSGTQRP